MIPTQEERDAIKARCEAATPGPWTLKPWGYVQEIHVYNEHNQMIGAPLTTGMPDAAWCATKEDAEFVVHARQDIPMLLDENDELRLANAAKDAEIARLETKLQGELLTRPIQMDGEAATRFVLAAELSECKQKLEAETKRADGNAMILYHDLAAERDRWKARSEALDRERELYKEMYTTTAKGKCEADARVAALERAIYGECEYCDKKYCTSNTQFGIISPSKHAICWADTKKHWQFDYKRFVNEEKMEKTTGAETQGEQAGDALRRLLNRIQREQEYGPPSAFTLASFGVTISNPDGTLRNLDEILTDLNALHIKDDV